MRVLIIGRGGREAAMAQKIVHDDIVNQVFVAPGNAGMHSYATRVAIDETAVDDLAEFAKEQKIELTIVGPEASLAAGVVDAFSAAGLLIWGPSKAAAQIESSKSFAKELMQKYDIPTAAYAVFHEATAAIAYIKQQSLPIVIKADGLAAGKGVVIAQSYNEAEQILNDWLGDNKLGSSGSRVVIEEFLSGEEFSFMTFVYRDKVYPIPLSQDHKRAYDGDLGPNTGGMGAYAPVPQISEALRHQALLTIMEATASAMIQEGVPFTGFLYGGIIATIDGPKVIEFNARFGDPEAEVILPLLASPLIPILLDILEDRKPVIKWRDQFALGVVLASEGYPQKPITGTMIKNLELLDNVDIFSAGVAEVDNQLVSDGGRIIVVTALAESLVEAQRKVYYELNKLSKDGFFYRHDIGNKALTK
ncbi:phosphoribosylamine--glycine ligase [Culicoidibacter larvae]|uniref:Phosphoribosylamine--glycine ligase n=1 Tax=Culicoidibacter larvae TaxID=2579976 RepID=A0A5R8QEW6_9FIRM|nr:phosphoribosylamine--glycine ligase [Culicoidibacter larvae]TLG74327.1 phosphoribosylamine--glycine ligase [Culicoidibacter larvae]